MRLSRLALLMLLLIPATAPAEPDEPDLLDQRTITDDTWIAYRFYAPVDAVVAVGGLESWFGGSFKGSITWLVDPEMNAEVGWVGRGWKTTSGRVVVDHEETGAHVDESVSPGGGPAGGGWSYVYPPSEGIYRLVRVVGADGDWSSTLDFLGSDGVELLDVASGPAELITEEDFEGMELNVSAAGYRVRRGTGAHVTRSFGSALFGLFAGADGARLSYGGPDGAEDYHNSYRFSGSSPGEWRFAIESSPPTDSTGRLDPGRTYLLVGDVVLP